MSKIVSTYYLCQFRDKGTLEERKRGFPMRTLSPIAPWENLRWVGKDTLENARKMRDQRLAWTFCEFRILKITEEVFE